LAGDLKQQTLHDQWTQIVPGSPLLRNPVDKIRPTLQLHGRFKTAALFAQIRKKLTGEFKDQTPGTGRTELIVVNLTGRPKSDGSVPA